jgi:multidrug efflux pump
MNISAFCIRRPAFTIVISLVMTIVGLIGFMNLPVRWIPNVNPPFVSIATYYPGANANLVESDVTKVIEDGLSGINGIETLESTSRQGESQISIKFKLGYSMDAVVEDVRSNLERVRASLPKEALNPVVSKSDPNSDAILYISFNDAHRNERELSDYVDKYILPSFQTIDGVGSVLVYGKRVSAIRISLDPEKMAAANVTADEITELVREQNASIPSGQIRGLDRYYSIVTDTGLKTAQQFNDLIIRDNQNQALRLKDIGEAKLDIEDTDSIFNVNGKPGLALAIFPQSTANPLEVEKQVKKAFKEIKANLPQGMRASILFNQTDYIRASVHSVYEAFFEAIIFVWLVILTFLSSFRATLIPIITIPVCLISTFAILYFFGFSINTITLMAFVLAIGLVVDDAIVMLENISRYREKGLSAFEAALKGSREIIFPIIAMTLTLAAVYAPVAFTPGLLGVLFREFTFTLAGAVIISGIVALTLSPMMCARVLNKTNLSNRYAQWQTQFLNRLQERYRQALSVLIEKRKWVIASLMIAMGLGFGMYKSLSSELAPSEDMNSLYAIVMAPHSASAQYTQYYAKQMEELYKQFPEIESYFSMAGAGSPSHVFQVLMLKPRAERKHSIEEMMAALNQQAAAISGVRINVFPPSSPLVQVASDEGIGLGLVLMTSNEYPKLQQASKQMVEALRKLPLFDYVDNSLKWDSEQFQINIDRDRAADLRVPIPSIANTISTLIAGRSIGKTENMNVLVQMNKEALANPNIFSQFYVRNNDGKMLPLTSLLNINEVSTSEVFKHYERLRSDKIYLSLSPKYKISEAVKAMKPVIKENLGNDMKFGFTGEAKSFNESSGKTAFTFFLALVFIYLVLVAQFESFIDPFIILLTVPFAMIGAFISLKLFGGTLNIYSNIGLITLIGLIAKHGILITDFSNRLRAAGKTVQEAVLEAAMLRLRPILMTTAAMVLGALPLAFASGAGAECRQQVGLVIVGGLLFGTFFSLVVVPIAYTYLAPFRKININSNSESDFKPNSILISQES